MLDNSHRRIYQAAVPRHWPCISLRAPITPTEAGDETTLWMRCSKHSADCATARLEIEETMRSLPQALVGTRCGGGGGGGGKVGGQGAPRLRAAARGSAVQRLSVPAKASASAHNTTASAGEALRLFLRRLIP